MDKRECALADRERRILGYLAGTLSAEEAEAFEAHYFGCDECSKELLQGLEIRAAVTGGRSEDRTIADGRSQGRLIQRWRWIAAAATVVLAVAVWRLSPAPTAPITGAPVRPAEPSPAPQETPVPPAAPMPATPPGRVPPPSPTRGAGDESTLRTPAQGLRPTATRESDGNVRIEWPAVDRATRYVVTIIAPDGTEILRRETATPALVIDAASLSARPAGERQFAQVAAMSALQLEVAKSPRIDLPVRREEAP